MILVTGSVVGSPETIDELLEVSLAHVHRSRAEPGCVSHDVHRHVEDPLTLVFLERWADLDALRTHFAVIGSTDFTERVGALAVGRPTLEIYEATPTRP